VTRREILTRSCLAAAAALCLAVAAGLTLLAADVTRWRDAVASGDVRFRAPGDDDELWQAHEQVPLGAARALLGVEDDLAFRRALVAVRASRLEETTVSDPEVALLRNAARGRLEAIVTDDHERSRQSRAAGLLGVLGLARLASETQERAAVLSETIADLERAITLDPGNDEAKYNLELALQRGRGLQLTEGAGGANPTPGGSGAKGAGAGEPGSGY
jgi:hypothetical protein